MWKGGDEEAYLDIFGIASRATSPWQSEVDGYYAHPHTVAEMKRTNRPIDRVAFLFESGPAAPILSA